MPRPPEFVSGIDKLVQIVALELLNSGGRSIFRPGAGGGLRVLLGTNVDYEDPTELFADVRLTISQVEQNIKTAQVTTLRPPSERLAALQIVDLVPDLQDLTVTVLLGVVSEDQQLGQAQVQVS